MEEWHGISIARGEKQNQISSKLVFNVRFFNAFETKQEEASRENNNIRCFWLTGRVRNSARIR